MLKAFQRLWSDNLSYTDNEHWQGPGRARHTSSKKLLLGIEGTLAASSLLLVLAWYLSKAHSGFEIAIISQYVLTYAPTAFMLVVIAAWRQVDLACKIGAPWIALEHGRSPADKSVLLDYISTFQLLGFYQSLKNGHLAVTLGIVGFLLLKLATIASTGLLVLRPRASSYVQDVVIYDTFDGTLYNASDFTPLQDQMPVYTAYGLAMGQLEPPFGTSSSAAYTTFSCPASNTSDAVFEVEVDAFLPAFTCQHADITIEMVVTNTTDINPKHQIRLPYTECDSEIGPIYALNPTQYVCPSRQLSGTIYPFQCQVNARTETHYLLTMTDIRYQQTLNGTGNRDLGDPIVALDSSTTVARATSIMCQMSYTTARLNVSGSVDAYPSSIKPAGIPVPVTSGLDVLTADNLTHMVNMAASSASGIFGSKVNDYRLEYPDAILKLLALRTSNNTYEGLLDQNTFIEATQEVYKQLAIQVVSRRLRRGKPSSSPSYVFESMETLQITETSAWIMAGAFVATCLAGLVLLRLRATTVPNVQSLIRPCQIVRASSDLADVLQLTQGQNEADVKRILNEYEFSTQYNPIQDSLSVTTSNKQSSSPPSVARSGASHWWKQITISYWFFTLTFVYPTLVMALLEGLQHISETNDGIAAISTSTGFVQTAITNFVPALVMILLATMFNCLEFNVVLLYPYHKLTTGVFASQLQHQPPLHRLAIVSLWQAFRKLDFAPLGSSVAAFIGATLTIAVSGLYTIESIARPRSLDVSGLDSITPIWNNSVVDDGGAAILLSLTENLNLPYPQGTYEELYFPRPWSPALQNSHSRGSVENQVVELELPAYRGNLVCETAAIGEFNISVEKNRIQQSATITSIFPLPPNCLRGGYEGNSSNLSFSHTFPFERNATEAYVAKLLDIHVGPFDRIRGTSVGELSGNGNPDNPPGCPSIALIYGYLSPADLSQTNPTGETLAVQVCYQELHQVTINATLEGVSMKLPDRNPKIIVNETSAQTLKVPLGETDREETSGDQIAFQFRIQSHIDDSLSFFNDPDNIFSRGSNAFSTVDRFFQGIIYGRSNVPLERLQLRTQSDFDIVQRGIQGMYRKYMAQAMSRRMSTSVNNREASETGQNQALKFTGWFKSGDGVSQRRLVQHNTPKLILQCQIAVMIIGGLVAVSTMQLMNLLPAHGNPCTIWGQLGLWSKSSWCSEASARAEIQSLAPKFNVKLPAQSTVFEVDAEQASGDQLFRLGWWTRKKADSTLERWYGIDVVPRT
ncbi:hypothetical protein LTR64_002637 [Lithohypha guttulata]|uniref:uncharacterized protein n=1 Tax=Lithohypha guttulata TaxID=1690604 RepID=UPI002DE1922D|nr:hypothetical protein LTR51_001138 [Lithohypha guttulata]